MTEWMWRSRNAITLDENIYSFLGERVLIQRVYYGGGPRYLDRPGRNLRVERQARVVGLVPPRVSCRLTLAA
jgi:hypothetical protein